MTRAILTAVLLAATTTASAGTYLGIGIGPEPAVHDNAAAIDGSGRTGRVLGGYALGRFAVEASLTGQGLLDSRSVELNGRQLAVAGKLNFPLGSGFEAYGRLGLHHTWVSGNDNFDFAGDGLLLGGGVELKIPFGSLFLDYSYADAELKDPTEAQRMSYSTRQWILGITVGI